MPSVQSAQSLSTAPIPITRLSEIANDACDSAFQSTISYDHSSTSTWNTHIVNTILGNLVEETSPAGQQPLYKFAVNSTIIQHSTSGGAEQPGAGDVDGEGSSIEKRGMHSASGAFWNSEKDGMWNFKYEKSQYKDFDVVISVIWISMV